LPQEPGIDHLSRQQVVEIDRRLALDPTLTTVDYRAEEVGQCLATGLLDLVTGKVKSLAMLVRPFLVERESHRKDSHHLSPVRR
jgi:DNA-binding LacI/PurR family transcriptional regulator